MGGPEPQLQRQPVRPLTSFQKGCLIGCVVLALVVAGGLLGMGFWLRGLLREHPESSAQLFFPKSRASEVMVQPGGIARLLNSDLLGGLGSAWSLDGEWVAVCAMPRMDMRRFMFMPTQREWNPRKIQKEQQAKVMAAFAPRLYLIDVASRETQLLAPPSEAEQVPQGVAWLPDGRLVVCTYPYEMSEGPGGGNQTREARIWLVNPAAESWEEIARFKGWTQVWGTPQGVVLCTYTEGEGDAYRVLVATEQAPRLWEVARGYFLYFHWAADGNLYQWGTVQRGKTTGLWRFSPSGDKPQRVEVHRQAGRSSRPVADHEMLLRTGFDKESGRGDAVFAVDPATGSMRRLSEELSAAGTQVLGHLFDGRWVLLAQRLSPERSRNLAALCVADGQVYPVVAEEAFDSLALPWQVLSPTANTLLLHREPSAADVFKLFAGGFGSELWLLQLDEQQLLQQEPVEFRPPED